MQLPEQTKEKEQMEEGIEDEEKALQAFAALDAVVFDFLRGLGNNEWAAFLEKVSIRRRGHSTQPPLSERHDADSLGNGQDRRRLQQQYYLGDTKPYVAAHPTPRYQPGQDQDPQPPETEALDQVDGDEDSQSDVPA